MDGVQFEDAVMQEEIFGPIMPIIAYEKFVKENAFWLEKDSLYEALIEEHQNDYYPMWKSDMDKRLFNPNNEEEKEKFAQRIEELKAKYVDVIEYYSFC